MLSNDRASARRPSAPHDATLPDRRRLLALVSRRVIDGRFVQFFERLYSPFSAMTDRMLSYCSDPSNVSVDR